MVVMRFFADLRERARTKEARIEARNVRELLETLFFTHREVYDAVVDGSEPRRYVRIFLNGRDITFLEGLETPLGPHDEVALFPPVAGG
jgi:MoaD family protein